MLLYDALYAWRRDASQIKRFDLRTGDTVMGQVRPPKEGERYLAKPFTIDQLVSVVSRALDGETSVSLARADPA